jgi:hypothetical protein
MTAKQIKEQEAEEAITRQSAECSGELPDPPTWLDAEKPTLVDIVIHGLDNDLPDETVYS